MNVGSRSDGRQRPARFRAGRPGRGLTLAAAAVLFLTGTMAAAAVKGEGQLRRERGLRALASARYEEALAVFDSLVIADLGDFGAGHLAARAEGALGRPGRARCRWLEIEALSGDEEVGRLARHERVVLERELADRQLRLGAAWFAGDAPGLEAPGLVLLPLESLGSGPEDAYYGLAWSYLLADALGGSQLCPAPIPSTLLALDLITDGSGVRLPAAVAAQPVNTVGGLRGRLALLPRAAGGGMLGAGDGGWDEAFGEALRFFQQTQGLPPTGEGDPATQQRLDDVLRAWLETPPPPLAPHLVPRVLGVLGATRAVRGTYRIEGGSVRVQMGLVDVRGEPTDPTPILLDFPLDGTVAAAEKAAIEIIRRSGGRVLPAESALPALGIADWSTAARLRLVFDRGLPRLEPGRWDRLPSALRRWAPLASLHAATLADPEVHAQATRAWEQAWAEAVRLDRQAAHAAFRRSLVAGGAAANATSPTQVLGSSGRIRIGGIRP